ncbi:MAG: hypothetical protein Q8L09_05010, partial [Candidatus Moranbacteria bacterium]|nr:hypothetical protein [Candidatus Moranbacteria bacterium]
MKEEKYTKKISDIFFGKAEDAFRNIRLFLTEKKFAKILETEKKAIKNVRARLAELYGGEIEPGNGSLASTLEAKLPKNKPEIAKKKEAKKNLVFVLLSEIAKNSTYSKNYINFSARQGKLKAKKIKGVWHTTEEWLAEFTKKSQAKKNTFKEKLSRDLGGNKKFAVPEEVEKVGGAHVRPEKTQAAFMRPLRLYFQKLGFWTTKVLADVKTWFRELKEMGDTNTLAKLKKAKLSDFLKLNYAKPAAAMIVLVLLMVIGNITKADLANLGDQGKKKIYFTYNAAVDGVSKAAERIDAGAAKQIAKVKIGKDRFSKIAENFLRREKIKEFEKNTGLSLKGDENGKGEIAGVETEQGDNGGRLASSAGKVLAATTATGTAQINVGDIEVSAYLMDGEDKEIANGEYEVRFGIYTADRTEQDPYPSDADKGTRVWEETQKVVVENGLLKTYLGATTPIPANFNFAASNYYIGLRIGEDAEMVPRKRIGAMPLARTAMSVAGQTIGNGAGNIPLSNGTLNTNLNADLLDGQHSTAFQVAGSYQPAGTYDNYVAWKLQSSATDAGQKIKANKGAIFTGADGIATSRTLNTLTVSPTYGSTENTIAQGSTVITVNTEGNMQGGGSGTAGGGISLTLDTIDNPIFTTVYLSTLDLGTNTITDGNMTGSWDFNAGNLSGITALTATTGNFTTLDLGTNTITDGNMNGDWNFNSAALTGVASIDTITTSSTALTFTSTAPTISVSTAATAINLEAGTTGEIN